MRRFLISGRVQGVGFRYGTHLEAQRLRLRGFARNLPDGSVEVVAQGADAALEALREWLAHGPAHARVEAVSETDAAAATRKIPEEFAVF